MIKFFWKKVARNWFFNTTSQPLGHPPPPHLCLLKNLDLVEVEVVVAAAVVALVAGPVGCLIGLSVVE
jgi:hypothetical protein